MAKCSQTSFSWEKLFIRVLHLVLTTFVITVLILKDTDVIMVAYEKSKEDNTEGEPLISENCEVFGEPPFHSLPKLRRCGYCNLMQPLRSKHCEDCNRCVYRYDHHCPWLGNCVGERNHRYFWAFLLFETILIAWSIEIGWFGFQRKTLWSDWIYSNGILVVVMFILVIAVIVVTLLFGCHSYLIIIGRTTWEHMAHSKISYLKIFKEGENPFHEGYIKNVCKFMCHCRIRKWESIFHRSSINLGV
ncbi:palmitoyltransferase ZDHHC12-B-like isoform X2 [Xenia sp. Carnegie-2017]|uniref:palmitoyltransferase ZDHHC12-B-like isoform X2 n=1 Tax=Xenia sp. Carnegie-2017 TaxID=2897299 RepID=UPI001F04F2FF|nr:palmitoyltransferase ZDHHC12-B-like isoform X2 [Xenia sp. Carnegie-2017]